MWHSPFTSIVFSYVLVPKLTVPDRDLVPYLSGPLLMCPPSDPQVFPHTYPNTVISLATHPGVPDDAIVLNDVQRHTCGVAAYMPHRGAACHTGGLHLARVRTLAFSMTAVVRRHAVQCRPAMCGPSAMPPGVITFDPVQGYVCSITRRPMPRMLPQWLPQALPPTTQ